VYQFLFVLQNFVHFTTIPPFCLEAEHLEYIMRRFGSKRSIMYLQCSASKQNGGIVVK